MKKPVWASLLFILAAHMTTSAGGNELTGEIKTWTKQGVLRGATSTEQECTRADRVWVQDEKTSSGYCIRFFQNKTKAVEGVAIFYFSGDLVGSDWDQYGYPIRAIYVDAAGEGVSLYRDTERLTRSSKDNLLFVMSRPGQLGSSGDHKEKFKSHESRVMNSAIDQIKGKYNLSEVVLAGHSGGALLIANLLAKRSDIRCAVMGSGAIALNEYAYDSRFASEVWGTWEDPMNSVKKIAPSAAQYYILAGKGDTIRPPKYQEMYANALAAASLNAHFLLLRKRGDPHDLVHEIFRVADACARRQSPEQIKRNLKVLRPQ